MSSLRDIAADLGVSVSLVSKVLNGTLGTTGVREAVAQTIRRRSGELGYKKTCPPRGCEMGGTRCWGCFSAGPA